jgi:hypothetical protein
MPTFTPIETSLPIRQDSCNLVDVSWQEDRLTALFAISDFSARDPKAVRVTMGGTVVMRVVDEIAYSIEERGEDIGITRSGFAYTVTDSLFWNSLHEAVKLSHRGLAQYSFISLDNCLDVIADNPPRFELVDLKPWLDSTQGGRPQP